MVDSAHELTWQPAKFERAKAEQAAWRTLFELRELALLELEKARQRKQLGKALEAKLSLVGSSQMLANANEHQESLRELLNVSQLEIKSDGADKVTVIVSRADGTKCERCWHWETDVGSHPDHPTICARCVRAVEEVLASR